ncbi:aldehyde dehydrogenase family protein [Amycolatopsis ultiminotia]|uniref:Aldehyde dehydrogenase family protein n=1 Tax=Amycolatopsis ultiminotia TaxID=543629 RepID=A0ABP6WLE7_9PSEU
MPSTITNNAPVTNQIDPVDHYIAGRWQSSPDRFATTNPLDDSVVAHIAAGGPDEARAAVDAAAQAFPAWASMLPVERQRLFLHAADLVEARTEQIVRILAVEAGTSTAFAKFQIAWSANLLRQAAGWGYLPYGDLLPSDTPGRFAMAMRKPLGVVAGFTPWNGAFNLAWRTIVLPLAFGNTVLIKPSEEAPISAGLLHAQILHDAGFPAGVVNVVTHAPGQAAPLADVFFESPAVRCINFTGSATTARMLAAKAGAALKPIVLELGGYNPLVILDDADLDQAVDATVFGAFFHQGQICMNTRKVYIDAQLHDEYLVRLAAKTDALVRGNPLDPEVIIGPLINDRAVTQMETRIQDAVDKGARVISGNQRDQRVFAPTVLADVPPTAVATIGQEETFGPLLVVEAVDSVEQAVSRAQAVPYGLSAAIVTGDEERGLDLARRFDAGIVHVNSSTMAGEPALPNGGVKDSGWGRSGHYAIEDFTEIRLVTTTHGPAKYPF